MREGAGAQEGMFCCFHNSAGQLGGRRLALGKNSQKPQLLFFENDGTFSECTSEKVWSIGKVRGPRDLHSEDPLASSGLLRESGERGTVVLVDASRAVRHYSINNLNKCKFLIADEKKLKGM